jgi:hypothetical protein
MSNAEDVRLALHRVRPGTGAPYPGWEGADYGLRLVRCAGMATAGSCDADDFPVRGEVHTPQTKVISFTESVVNVASGFVISLILWQWVVAPAFGYEVTIVTNLQLTSIFTTISVLRGYLWRRVFERMLNQWLTKLFYGRES